MASGWAGSVRRLRYVTSPRHARVKARAWRIHITLGLDAITAARRGRCPASDREFLLDVLVDACEPLLGALRPVVVVPNVGLELLDLRGAQLQRELVRHIHGALAIPVAVSEACCSRATIAGRAAVHRVAVVTRLPIGGRERNDLLHGLGGRSLIVNSENC